MKISPIALAVVLVASTGAWAQVRDQTQVPGEQAKADAAADGRTFGEKVRAGADKVTDTTKRVFNKAKGETKDAAHATQRESHQARRDAKKDDRHAMKDMDKSERHANKAGKRAHRDDTRAMGAPDRSMDADADQSRRERMDEAYDHWKSQQKG